eukprot:2038555-Rhodomonas_salina.3
MPGPNVPCPAVPDRRVELAGHPLRQRSERDPSRRATVRWRADQYQPSLWPYAPATVSPVRLNSAVLCVRPDGPREDSADRRAHRTAVPGCALCDLPHGAGY